MKKYFYLMIIISTFANYHILIAKKYKGAEYRTKATYLYGRFEVRMKPAHRSGVVSSFFTYHEISNIKDWNEIDIENIGRYDDQIQFNTITSNITNHVRNQPTGFNPYADYHVYAFEWTPFYVAWFIDGKEVYRQTDSHVGTLNKPQKIMMNLWVSDAADWVGSWNDYSLPAFAYYDWVKYYSYTPGAGSYGTDNNFKLNWKDDFNDFDSGKWQKATHTFNGNLVDFLPANIVFKNGKMILCLTDELNTGYTDVSSPVVLWAKAFSDGKIEAAFSEELDSTSAETASNYNLSFGKVISAQLSEDRSKVFLTTDGFTPTETANLIVMNVKDIFGNTVQLKAVSIVKAEYISLPAKINCGGSSTSGFLNDLDWDYSQKYGHISGWDKNWNGIDIKNTTLDQIYLHDREGLTKYLVKVPNGKYKVTLMFAEKYWDSPNKRIFDVYAENKKVIDGLDILAKVGKNSALNVSFEVNVADELLDLIFAPLKDIALISGIKIQQSVNSVGKIGGKMDFNLYQNYPNPFGKFSGNGKITNIKYDISGINKGDAFTQASASKVVLKVYDSLGREIKTLVNKYQPPGKYFLQFYADNLPTGVYFLVLNVGQKFFTRKMLFMK